MQETWDEGSIPGSERSPRRGHGNPLHYSCLKNPMDRGAWWATVYRVAKNQKWLKQLSTRAHMRVSLWPDGPCGPPGSSVHEVSQARILEWVAISSSRRSSQHRDGTCVSKISRIGKWVLYHCATWEVHVNEYILDKHWKKTASSVASWILCGWSRLWLVTFWTDKQKQGGILVSLTISECLLGGKCSQLIRYDLWGGKDNPLTISHSCAALGLLVWLGELGLESTGVHVLIDVGPALLRLRSFQCDHPSQALSAERFTLQALKWTCPDLSPNCTM